MAILEWTVVILCAGKRVHSPRLKTVFGSVQQVQQDNRLADPSNSPLPFLFFIISFRNERREEQVPLIWVSVSRECSPEFDRNG